MNIIQIIIIAIAVFAVSRALWQFRKGALTIAMLGFWVLFWVIAGVVAVLPQTTDVLAQFVGVGRGADAVIYLSLIILFLLAFRMFVRIEDVEREITRLVRSNALKDLGKDDK